LRNKKNGKTDTWVPSLVEHKKSVLYIFIFLGKTNLYYIWKVFLFEKNHIYSVWRKKGFHVGKKGKARRKPTNDVIMARKYEGLAIGIDQQHIHVLQYGRNKTLELKSFTTIKATEQHLLVLLSPKIKVDWWCC